MEQEGLLFKGNKQALQPEMLKMIHNAHLGMEKCKYRARDLFWPGMNAEIEIMVKRCQICQDQQHRNMKEPLHLHEIPSRPWTIVAQSYLILVNSYSGFFVIAKL